MISNTIDGVMLKRVLKSSAALLELNKEEVNSLNVFPVPDGDTGTNMMLTVKSALKEGLEVEENNASKVALGASQGSLMGARGNSGVILSQLFRGFANGLKGNETIDIKLLAEALKQASETAYKAVMKPTEGTILTVARECGEYAMSIYRKEEDIAEFIKKVIAHGNQTLERTPEMLPVLKQAGVVDAGGKGLMYLYTGFYNALIGADDYANIEVEPLEPIKETKKHREHLDTDDIEFGYCTEFMINTNYDDIDNLKDDLSKLGDSLLVVGGEGIIKVHVHTNNPGVALEAALKLGSLKDIKIDNMRFQHEEVLLKDELIAISNKQEEVAIDKDYSFISVSIGDGIDEVFNNLNVDEIVSGGQTMNPSTEDFINAINKTSGRNIIILPNNSNIILAAEQTKNISDRNITVLETKNIPQGISALLAFNEEIGLEENIENMNEAIKSIVTSQVTYAVRDTEYNGSKIYKDDIIGLSGKEILCAGKDINDVTMELINKSYNDEASIITVLFGEDVAEELSNDLLERLENRYDDMDIEVIYGGQPLYYYIISIE